MSLVQPAPVQLLQAGWEQLDQVMEVMAAAFEPQFGEAWTRPQCAGILPMSGVRMVLALGADRQPKGFSLTRTVAAESELLLLAVIPASRRSGVGSALLDRFITDAKAGGVELLHLEVRDGNPAVDMYRRHGFEVQGRRAKYYRGKDGAFHDALTMVRRASIN